MSDDEKKTVSLMSDDAQRIMDRDFAFESLNQNRQQLAALKSRHEIARNVGIEGEHPNTLMEAINRQERVVKVLAEFCQKLESVPEGKVYSPSDLTIVRGSK